MKKLLIAVIFSSLIAGLAFAVSSINFDSKIFNLKYSKAFGKNSTIEVYLPQNESNNNYSAGILKGNFSMQDAQGDKFKEEMENSTKEIWRPFFSSAEHAIKSFF